MRPVSSAMLARKFAKRDAVAAKLRAIDSEIAEAGRDYSFANGFRVALRPEQLRRAVGA